MSTMSWHARSASMTMMQTSWPPWLAKENTKMQTSITGKNTSASTTDMSSDRRTRNSTVNTTAHTLPAAITYTATG